VTVLSRETVVRVDYRVRRRRYAETTWLVRHTEFYELDDVADAVWLGCERGDTVGGIVEAVSRAHHLAFGEALARTAVTLERFRALGFVHYEAQAVGRGD